MLLGNLGAPNFVRNLSGKNLNEKENKNLTKKQMRENLRKRKIRKENKKRKRKSAFLNL